MMDPGRKYYSEVETMPYAELEELQLRKLRAIVRHAYENSPFHRRLWRAAGITPDDVNTVEDFRRRIPVYTKDDVRKWMLQGDVDSLLGTSRPISLYSLTSGTTGVNTVLPLNYGFLDEIVERLFMRQFWMAKLRPGMSAFQVLAGWHFLGLVTNMVFSRMGVRAVAPWGTSIHDYVGGFVDALIRHRPEYFVGMPWMVDAMIEEGIRRGMDPRDLFRGVRYLHLAGEPMTPGLVRELRERTGVEDVFNAGGTADGIWGSSDCEHHRGIHVWMDVNFLEVVDPKTGEPLEYGERGRWVSTLLIPGGPTVVRYLGDDIVRVEKERCECGRTHYSVQFYDRIENSFIKGGRHLTPYDVALAVEAVCGHRLFTVLKPESSGDSIMLLIARSGEGDPCVGASDKIDAEFRRRFGVGADVRWVDARELPFAHRKLIRVYRESEGDAS
ncbi:MAG: phenylacetate--CoA ligase family protein [Conexivisphaera sp.]